jgi:hypothetical protein
MSVGLLSGFKKTNNHKSPRQKRCNKKFQEIIDDNQQKIVVTVIVEN